MAGRPPLPGTGTPVRQMSTTRYVLLLFGTLAVAGAPLGHRMGLLPPGAAVGLLLVGLLPALWVLAAGGLMLARGGLARLDLGTGAALALAAGISTIPIATIVRSIGAPPIADITTDTEDPPRFDAIAALRDGESNPLEYRGPELAAVQRAAYPDIQPLQVPGDPAGVADVALAVAQDLGWQVVAVESFGAEESREIGANDRWRSSESYRGVRIEATDTTYWFGFMDDVAVRLRRARDVPDATTVDVRSLSRVGISDLGANAARVRRFLDRLAAAVE